MNNKSLIATILFAVFTFPQIFGCAGTDFGRAVEAGMGHDAYHKLATLGSGNKGVYLACMALSKDAAVILPGMYYMRLGPNPQDVNIALEYTYQGTDYVVIRCKLADGTTKTSLIIIPQRGSDTKVFTLMKDNGNQYTMYPAGNGYTLLAQATKEDNQNAFLIVINGSTTDGDAVMSYKDLSAGVAFDPRTKTISTLRQLSDKSKQSKPKVTKIETDSMPAAQSIPLTRKDEQPTSAPKESTPATGKSSAPAPQSTPEPAPSGPKVLQDSKPDTQSIL